MNTNEAMLEAFFKKMMEQVQQPSHTGFFLMTEKMLDKLVKIDLDPHELELHRVNPAEYLKKHTNRTRSKRRVAETKLPKALSSQWMSVKKTVRNFKSTESMPPYNVAF